MEIYNVRISIKDYFDFKNEKEILMDLKEVEYLAIKRFLDELSRDSDYNTSITRSRVI